MEEFALTTDREAFLAQLIPGTEDYYYYHCLQLQHQARFAEVEPLTDKWIERHGYTSRVEEINNRQALLTWEQQPKASSERIRDELDLTFDHERQAERQETSHATRLDPTTFGVAGLARQAFDQHVNLDGFTDAALEWLAAQKLNAEQRRHLLGRLRRPDQPGLVDLVEADLKHRHSSGFGSLPIHGLMLSRQLDDLVERMPELNTQTAFVQARLKKLLPGPDVDWQNDAQAGRAYLDRLWLSVAMLPPAFNSLKVHVLYHRLDHDHRHGIHERQRFLEYLALPRRVNYAAEDFQKRREFRDQAASMGEDFSALTHLPPVYDDEALVRAYLERFFVEEEDWREFAVFVSDELLRTVFACTKILYGLGDMEAHYSTLNDPGAYQRLKDRIELEFAPENPRIVGLNDPVVVQVDVKNVDTLVIKVFEINTLNYFLAHGREPDSAIDLDGLIASHEETHKTEPAPLRRVRRTFSFPELTEPGLYVIELIGNGKSSRALIRKGSLRFVERCGAAGHVFRVIDEQNQPQPEAAIWMAGREYKPDAEGRIGIPYSTAPRNQAILISHQGIQTVSSFSHRAERYEFTAAFHLDRESLLKRRQADLLVRAQLCVNGAPTSLTLLEDTTLIIESTDRHGVSTSREAADFALQSDVESVYTFQVPEDLAQLRVSLGGRVENLSLQQKQDLGASRTFHINGIDTTDHIEDLHLSRTSAGHVLYLLGKTGEALAGVPVVVTAQHRYFQRQYQITLQTDERGRMELGPLPGISQLTARSPCGVEASWPLEPERCRYPRTLHALADETIRLPLVGEDGGELRSRFSLLSRCQDTYLADELEQLTVVDGFLVIAGLPAGDHDLWLKESNTHIALRVCAGREVGGWLISDLRQLERRPRKALHLIELTAGTDRLRLRLANAGPATRVHVLASRFLPAHSAYQAFAGLAFAEPQAITLSRAANTYLSGRDIGDEYRYILDRKYARKYPGNLLGRPGLLLNPWAVRSTDTGLDEAGLGEGYGAGVGGGMRAGASAPAPQASTTMGAGAHANLDFLAAPAVVRCNLRPDADGGLDVELGPLAHTCQIRVLAVDGAQLIQREVLRDEPAAAHQDLRLDLGLEPEVHYTEKKQVTPLAASEALTIDDITTSQLELLDSLARVYRLFATLSDDPTLADFGFILTWPELSEEEKRRRYSEFACHELNFFLAHKDVGFFDRVIRPYLAHKRHKTFMDHYLVEADLTPYLKPWAYGRLNALERILLAGRMPGLRGAGARKAGDLFELLPPDVERDSRLFKTAMQGSALDAKDGLGLQAAQEQARDMKKMARARRGAPPMPPPAPKCMSAPMGAMPEEPEPCLEAEEECLACDMDDETDGFMAMKEERADLRSRSELRQLYRKLDATKEWAENNYYHLPQERQGPELITINAFWLDYARREGEGPFLSRHVAQASRCFSEMMCALAVLDLPFQAEKPEVAYAELSMTLKPLGPTIVFHQEIKPAAQAAERAPILVSQNYFRADDRYRYENGETFDKYVGDEFLIHTVYLCQVVLTNPTSTRQKLDLLLQIPRGAIPVQNGFVTRGTHLWLESYATESIEYAFYFPQPGRFDHFPVQVTRNEELIAAAGAAALTVVEEPSQIDRSSWAYLSQHGRAEEVLAHLEANNIERLDLDLIAWRMSDRPFWSRVMDLLSGRHVYSHTLWSYSVRHRDETRLAEFLEHCEDWLSECGLWLESPVVCVDPIARGWYEHLEYAPLVNARAHPLGGKHKILNNRFAEQFARFCRLMCYRPALSDDDCLAAAYYLLLQDRIEDGLAAFDRVDGVRVASRIQYDYMKVYCDFYRSRPEQALQTAEAYRDHPVDRWRKLFANALAQLAELDGSASRVTDEEDRQQRQDALADTEPSFEFELRPGWVDLRYRNLTRCRVNFYLMDVELLFSRQPFVQQQSDQFSFVKPNRSQELTLAPDVRNQRIDLPSDYLSANVVIEIEAGGRRKSQACYANQLEVQIVEGYGQLAISHQETGRPLPGAYVKAYARMNDGQVRFYKDGYTDLRGRFDYTSLNTDELQNTERFALLVLSEEHGAVIREANPPKR